MTTTDNYTLAQVDRAWSNSVSIIWDAIPDWTTKVAIVAKLEQARVDHLGQVQRELAAMKPDDICALQGHQWKQWANHLNCERCNESIEIDCV